MEVKSTEKEEELELEFSDEEYENYCKSKKEICEATGIDYDELGDDVLVLSIIERSIDNLNNEDFHALIKKRHVEGI